MGRGMGRDAQACRLTRFTRVRSQRMMVARKDDMVAIELADKIEEAM